MTDEEEATAQLLRLARPGDDLPADRAARMRGRVHDQWHTSRRHRTLRRGAAAATALLAAAAALIVGVRVTAPRDVSPPQIEQVLAHGERIQGTPLVHDLREGRNDGKPLTRSTSIHAGDVIETDATSRAALRAADGSSVRIDTRSRVRAIAPRVFELIEGAVYVATREGSRGFEIRTPMGAVRDVGTQFEVRLGAASLRLRVRAGAVEIQRGAAMTSASAGTDVTVTSDGVATAPVPTYGPEWEWAAALAPSFAIDGRSLHVFLEHLAEEQGWTLRYADPALAAASSRIVLRGSIEGLPAEQALSVALATSGLQYRLRSGELLVSRPAGAQ